MGVALLRRHRNWDLQLSSASERVDAAQSCTAAVGGHSAIRRGGACAGRFSTSDRIDPAVCGNVSGSLLGKHALEGPWIANDSTRRPQHELALCYLSGALVLAALRSVTFVVRLGSVIVAVAARIRSLFFAITMRSIIVIIADSATPPQSIQDQTGRANS
jgi:hypothetical protein